jgi:hypothetical protein
VAAAATCPPACAKLTPAPVLPQHPLINLTPADLRKEGLVYDLPVAVAWSNDLPKARFGVSQFGLLTSPPACAIMITRGYRSSLFLHLVHAKARSQTTAPGQKPQADAQSSLVKTGACRHERGDAYRSDPASIYGVCLAHDESSIGTIIYVLK